MKHWRLLYLCLMLLLMVTIAVACGTGDDDDEGGDDDDDTAGESILSDDEEMKNDGVAEAPPMSIDPERPTSNSSVTVAVKAPGSTSIDLTVAGFGCGSLFGSSGTTPLVITGTAADNGYCSLSALAHYDGEEDQVLEGFYEIQASDPDIPPVGVPGGSYEFAEFPQASGTADDPVITGVSGTETFINGSTANFSFSYAGDEVTHAYVAIDGYDGYWVAPVTEKDGTFDLPLSFDADIFDQLNTKASAVQVSVSVVDALGYSSEVFDLFLEGVEVAQGEVKVSLTWDTMTDVDLHVTEPNGEEIYYGYKYSSTGGQLDLDSNAGCNIDGINNENVFWPDGQSPNGSFAVKAHMWSDCDEGGASGTVTITYCGDDSPLVYPFSLGPTGDEDTWYFDSACGYRVSGTIKYEDFAIKKTGLSASGTMVPVRYAIVQVLRASDDEVMGQSATDAKGKYSIDFINDGEAGYYVRVLAAADSDNLKQTVTDLNGNLYGWKTADNYNELTDPIKTGVDLEIKKSEDAGAMNIFDVGATCAAHARLYGGSTPPEVTFLWTDGKKPLGKAASFATSTNKIYILGMASDRDDYDDIIIGHEYGHFVMNNYSKGNSPGGGHSSNKREDPRLSYSEGWATYFGITANKVTSYMDTNASGMGVYYNLETLPASKPLGNKGNAMDGKLSEAVVAAAFLDLHDSTNETKDTISGKVTSIWSVFLNYMKAGNSKFKDRGVAGRDFVDFLDGWFCMGFDDKGTDDTKGVRGIVKGLLKLSYDFANVASCK